MDIEVRFRQEPRYVDYDFNNLYFIGNDIVDSGINVRKLIINPIHNAIRINILNCIYIMSVKSKYKKIILAIEKSQLE